ncbi:hypothetical protein DERF_002847 [Dermatophagoides farinae]|uniref:Uncharacterized protein n=1 Tax=Dermatophagoides farinae TaxID=6954 RepID=A0A922LAX1_DERFA|nr:hypothetical protein DERF_002847 [Dermatophagoides farinae]
MINKTPVLETVTIEINEHKPFNIGKQTDKKIRTFDTTSFGVDVFSHFWRNLILDNEKKDYSSNNK